MRTQHVLITLACTLTLLAGCGGGSLPTYLADGKVLYEDGRPVTSVTVTLHPLAGGEHAPSGKVDANGQFRLTTFEDGDGAPAGYYTVFFTAASPDTDLTPPGADPASISTKPQLIPPEYLVASEYLSPQTSKLSVEIKADGENKLHFKVKRPARRQPMGF